MIKGLCNQSQESIVQMPGCFNTRRLELNLTRSALAKKSGVSLGSLQRFENEAEISLKSLLKIAVALNATEEFKQLFSKVAYKSIKDIIKNQENKTRQRGRKND